jgi:hypothetical protein
MRYKKCVQHLHIDFSSKGKNKIFVAEFEPLQED